MGELYKHKKRGGSCVIVGEAEVQAAEPLTDYEVVVVYRGLDGKLWVRRRSEFFDGRFEKITPVTNGERP